MAKESPDEKSFQHPIIGQLSLLPKRKIRGCLDHMH